MIPRYTRPEMGRIWSDENKFLKWLEVEIATAEAEAEAGLIPRSAARAIRRKGRFSVERILEIEKKVKHDVIAFTTNVAENIGREGRYLHYGLTSNDVVDTAPALQVREASALLLNGLARLGDVLKKGAIEFKHAPLAGRTPAIPSAPKCARWRSTSRPTRRGRPPCLTNATPSRRSRSAAWLAWSAPTLKPGSKTWRSGTSATSRIPQSSASSCPTRPSLSTT